MYPAKLSFKYEGEIKTCPDIQKLREFSTMRHALQEIMKGIGTRKQWQNKKNKIMSKEINRQIEIEECNPY